MSETPTPVRGSYPVNFLTYLLSKIVGDCTCYYDPNMHDAYHMRLGNSSEYAFRLPNDEPINNVRLAALLIHLGQKIRARRTGYVSLHARVASMPSAGRFIGFYVADIDKNPPPLDQASESS